MSACRSKHKGDTLIPPIPAGPIALVGSGEYTPAMATVDQQLLAILDAASARVAVIPTASALEPGQPERWNAMGVAHFAALGAQVTPLALLNRADALDPALAAVLGEQQFFYFSGGQPDYLVETLRDTPAWQTIRTRHAAGAVLAGCSAGAMMLGGYTLSVRALRNGEGPQWNPALGVVPGLVVLPHFDRMRYFIGDELFAQVLAAAPAELLVVGVDEDTALVGLPDGDAYRWQVLGRQSVSVFAPGRAPVVYQSGAVLPMANGRL